MEKLIFYWSARKDRKWRERVSEPSTINGTCRGTQSTYLSMYIGDVEHNGDVRFQILSYSVPTYTRYNSNRGRLIELIVRYT